MSAPLKQELAIFGGDSVRASLLPYGQQAVDDEDVQAIISVLHGQFLTTGPQVTMFEKRLASEVGAMFAVAVSSGTAALHCACFAAGIKIGDEVIVPPMTFAATSNCVVYMGATPVFADIDPTTGNLDPLAAEACVTKRTKAIIAVDFAGRPCNLPELRKIADKHGIFLIEDASHSLGAELEGQKVGSIADLTCFSFHPVKPITTGEGGAVVTNCPTLHKKSSCFRTHGITRDRCLMERDEGPWYYEQHALGFNYRITDIQCALGLNQLNKLHLFTQKRQFIAEQYHQNLCRLEGIRLPAKDSVSIRSSWHIYVIRLHLENLTATRREIFEALTRENIGVNVHYIPVYYHPYYRKKGYDKGLCPNTEKMYNEIITLPIFPAMTDQDVQDVITAVKKVISFYMKEV